MSPPVPVTAADWRHHPLPELRYLLPIKRHFTAAEMAELQLGFLPDDMDDKWFIYWQNNTLYFHRSWTGFAIYEVSFEVAANGSGQIQACWVNDDPAQHRSFAASAEQHSLTSTIKSLLLGRASALTTPAE
jgi:hypothetical protein